MLVHQKFFIHIMVGLRSCNWWRICWISKDILSVKNVTGALTANCRPAPSPGDDSHIRGIEQTQNLVTIQEQSPEGCLFVFFFLLLSLSSVSSIPFFLSSYNQGSVSHPVVWFPFHTWWFSTSAFVLPIYHFFLLYCVLPTSYFFFSSSLDCLYFSLALAALLIYCFSIPWFVSLLLSSRLDFILLKSHLSAFYLIFSFPTLLSSAFLCSFTFTPVPILLSFLIFPFILVFLTYFLAFSSLPLNDVHFMYWPSFFAENNISFLQFSALWLSFSSLNGILLDFFLLLPFTFPHLLTQHFFRYFPLLLSSIFYLSCVPPKHRKAFYLSKAAASLAAESQHPDRLFPTRTFEGLTTSLLHQKHNDNILNMKIQSHC